MPARIFVIFLFLLLIPGLQDPQKPPEQKPEQNPGVISLDTTVVVLNVTVTDTLDRYVSKLKAEDFKIFEDQTPQKITSFSFNEMPFAAVILLDTSGSMERKMSIARSACARFIDGIRIGDVVAIYGFGGTRVTVLQEFSEVRDVGFEVWDTDAKGMTPMYDALVKAADNLAARPERRRVVLLLSDGADTQSRVSYDETMRRLIAAEISVYAVDLSDAAINRSGTRDAGSEVMKSFAVKTGGRFFATPGGDQLRDAFSQAVEELRNQYTITYEPTNERQDGKWRAIEARLSQATLKARTRPGYFAAKRR